MNYERFKQHLENFPEETQEQLVNLAFREKGLSVGAIARVLDIVLPLEGEDKAVGGSE